MCDCSWCVCTAILNKIGSAFHGEAQRNNPFFLFDYNWSTFIWELKKCTSQGKKNMGTLLIQRLNSLPFSRFFLRRKQGEEVGKALMKGRRMWGVLEESLRLPVCGSLLGGMACLLPPAGQLSQYLRGSAALRGERERDLVQEKAESRASTLSGSQWCKIFHRPFTAI